MAAGQADVISSQLNAEDYLSIAKEFLCNRMHGVPIGMRLELRKSVSECRQDVDEVMRLDRDQRDAFTL